MRKNLETKELCDYYRLVESYRNHNGSICLRTILSVGFWDELSVEQWNSIQKILTAKVSNAGNSLFESPQSDDPVVIDYVERLYHRMVTKKRIDVLGKELQSKPPRNGKDYQKIDVNSIRNKDIREIGAE